MATPRIKATYSLDVETVAQLERLARKWKTSKSEALRRLIRSGATAPVDDAAQKIDALERLQQSLGLTQQAADKWMRDVRMERRASSTPRRK